MVKKLILAPIVGAALAFVSPDAGQAGCTASPTPVICSLADGVRARIMAGREYTSRASLNRRRLNLDAQREWLNRQVRQHNAAVASYYARYYGAGQAEEHLFSPPNLGPYFPIIQEPTGPYLPPPPSGDPKGWESTTEERSVLVH